MDRYTLAEIATMPALRPLVQLTPSVEPN
jgi:hypothetical protein